MTIIEYGIAAVERGFTPDALARAGIRRLCRARLREERAIAAASPPDPVRQDFLESMRSGPIAPLPHKANEQHYELPAEFFVLMLGPRRKYSCCLFTRDGADLAEAEEAALEETCRRAQVADGQRILDLGCGWGSLSFWLAEHYPQCLITAVSNSHSQRAFIEIEAAARGYANLTVVTADINGFAAEPAAFDRVLSVEMFEHVRNHRRLLDRIAGWLRRDGKLFVHLFCHRELSYPFESEGDGDWMGRRFFSGGMMPSTDLLPRIEGNLAVTWRSAWNGHEYHRTAEAWLANLDTRRREAIRILAGAYGPAQGRRWLHRWRLFLMAVSELFGYAGGEEWFVSHYLFERKT